MCNILLYSARRPPYCDCLIRSFRHKGLRELFIDGNSAKVRPDLQGRCLARLDALDNAKNLKDVNVIGLDLHVLRGKPIRHSIKVNGPWRITFEWSRGDVERVDLEQYH